MHKGTEKMENACPPACLACPPIGRRADRLKAYGRRELQCRQGKWKMGKKQSNSLLTDAISIFHLPRQSRGQTSYI
ncbi:MAG: hypothetical protein FVQ77_02900 [Cytophagales bacterium]|nr:hypothetical protein [Cytophagales bacterium]